MKTDRRTFLSSLVASLAATAADPALGRADESAFQNDVLRFRFLKPAGWKYLNRLEWWLEWENLRYDSGDLTQEELKAALNQPVVVVMPVEEDSTNTRPTVSVFPQLGFLDDTPREAQEWLILHWARPHLLDFELVDAPAETVFGGAPSSRMTFRYTAESQAEGKVPAFSEHFIVHRTGVSLGVSFGRALSGHAQHVLDDLESIKRSFAFWA